MLPIKSCRHGNIPTPPSGYYALEVDLLCFSSGGGEHPSARESTLLVRNISSEEIVAMEIKICVGHLVMLLKEQWCQCKLLVFDWKTAQIIAVSVIGTVTKLAI
jgi:hypothetical protein